MHVKKQSECCNGNSGSDETICNRIREEIVPLLYQVVNSEEVRFHNAHMAHCWEKKGCVKTDCPGYGNTEIPCWYSTGTYCGGVIQGTFVDKCGGGRQCDVFKESCPTMVEEVGEALNHLLFSLREEKKTTRKQQKKIKYLNKELVAFLENLDTDREINELAIIDKLTGLYNRSYLLTVLDDEILRFQRREDPLTVMMIDLGDFKSVNGVYGHGDAGTVLSSFGSMLHRNIRKCDRPFRYGREKFVVVLPGTDMCGAWIQAERIEVAAGFEQRRSLPVGRGIVLADHACLKPVGHQDNPRTVFKPAVRNDAARFIGEIKPVDSWFVAQQGIQLRCKCVRVGQRDVVPRHGILDACQHSGWDVHHGLDMFTYARRHVPYQLLRHGVYNRVARPIADADQPEAEHEHNGRSRNDQAASQGRR
ncbi:MAG TPA: hypothetical protein DDY22_05775 [Geobacter sp.]|nr:hypothetical protein [Geobacter sp.]